MKEVGIEKVSDVVENSAIYYRDSRLYLSMSNATDAYNYYKEHFSDDITTLVAHGLTYEYKGNYIVGVVPDELKEEEPEVYEHYIGTEPFLMKQLERDTRPILFIPIYAPKDGKPNPNMIKLLNDFVKEYRNDYHLISDGAKVQDLNYFQTNTGAKVKHIIGNPYHYWDKDK